nr:UIM1 [Heterodera glycines]
MHSYQLGFHILLFSIIGLLYQAHGHENDEANTGYEGLSEQDMNDMGMDPGLIAGIMKARAEAGQGQSDAQGQQANNSPPPSAPRSPVTGPTVIQSAPSRPTVTQQQNEDNWFGHDETNWNDHNDHNNGTHVPAGSSSPVYRENWDNHDDVNWFAGNDDHNNGIHAPGLGDSSFPAHGDDDFQENLQRAFRESEQDFQSKNNAIYEENLRRALADSAQAIQSNNDHDFQSVIEASLALEEEKQIQLARTLSMGHSRNNYDNGVGSDNEDIETQQALIRSFSVQSNQRRSNRVSNPQDSDAEQYYGEASSSTNANVIKPKKKKKKNGNKKTEAERSLLSSSPSPSTQRLTRSRTTTKVKEEPSTSAESLRRSKTKKETRKEKEESSSAGSSSRSKTKKDDTTKEKGKNPLQKITKSLSSLKKIFQR